MKNSPFRREDYSKLLEDQESWTRLVDLPSMKLKPFQQIAMKIFKLTKIKDLESIFLLKKFEGSDNS